MDTLYQKVVEYVDQSFGKKSEHFERTVYWLLQLKPDADIYFQIAAYSHDIQRAFVFKETLEMVEKSESGFKDPEFLKSHQEDGAKRMYEFLMKNGCDEPDAKRVYHLISKHEEGGDEEQNILKDADSISYFECNADHFVTKYSPILGAKKIKDKFDWMFDRISSEKAKRIARPMYLHYLDNLLAKE